MTSSWGIFKAGSADLESLRAEDQKQAQGQWETGRNMGALGLGGKREWTILCLLRSQLYILP